MLGKIFEKVGSLFATDPYDEILRQMRAMERQHQKNVESIPSYQKLVRKCEEMERSRGIQTRGTPSPRA